MALVTLFATAASGTSWTTATNANADDGAYATYTIAAKNTTGNVNSLSSFGFDASIPVNSTINSVTLEVQHKVSVSTGIAFLESALAIGATVGTYNSNGTEPTTDTVATYNSMARPGGGSWTRADLLDANFTVKLRARSGNNATSVVYSWDYAKVTVDYTPQAFTLTAAAGSYALTGVASTLLKSRVLTAAAGSYTLTGVAATLTYTPLAGYTLTADAGAYALTGVAATLLRNRVLTADAGSYAMTGVAATFTRHRVLNAAAGSYVLTGGSATFDYSGGVTVGRRYKRYGKAYLQRGRDVLVFNSEEEKERFLESERPKKKAVKSAKPVKPAETIKLKQLEIQVERFNLPDPVRAIAFEQDFDRLLQIHLRVLELQDEEDIEILLLNI